jgi:hypothetical protein
MPKLLRYFFFFSVFYLLPLPELHSALSDTRTAWSNFSFSSNGFSAEYTYLGDTILDKTTGDTSYNISIGGANFDIASSNQTQPSTFFGYHNGGTRWGNSV